MLLPVRSSPDFERIKALPTREWHGNGQIASLMEDWLRLPGSQAKLRPEQVAALSELHDQDGVFGIISVGGGKTLISLLAPVVIEAKRPLLLLPASMIQPLKREAQKMAKDWRIARNLTLLSYEMLSRVTHVNFLDTLKPDLIIMDEVHKVKDTRRSRARRIRRYLAANSGGCKVLAMSGSITARSIFDYWHITRWCCPINTPLPRDFTTLSEWSEALDQKVMLRRPPGVLTQLHTDAKGSDALALARDAYSKRLTQTPGVVASRNEVPSAGLILQCTYPVVNRSVLEPAFRCLREKWELPSGIPFESALDLWRHCRELSTGFYYEWLYPPPKDWLAARKAWSTICRHFLNNARGNLDTPMAVAQAIDKHLIDDKGALEVWRKIEPSFKPITIPHWVDDSLVKYAEKWAKLSGGLVWTEFKAFGERLSGVSGIPYFSQNACSATGKHILDHKGAAILSVSSCSTGLNLQEKWADNLLASFPPNGKSLEQLLGRTHRPGQTEDDVSVEIPLVCIESWRGLERACQDAKYIQETTGAAQKLIYATKIDFLEEQELISKGMKEYLWLG
jgi:hypothetical protein